MMGTLAVVRLGQNAKVRKLVSDANVFHWNPYYSKSPYRHSFSRGVLQTVTSSLKMDPSSCQIGGNPTCCLAAGGNLWETFLQTLNSVVSGDAGTGFNKEKARRKFTFAISAPMD